MPKAKDFYNNLLRQAANYLKDPNSLNRLINKADRKANILNRSSSEIDALRLKLVTLLQMLNAYRKGQYKDVPWKTLVAMVAGLIYFVLPVDAIPDIIPITGYVDDFSILLWIFNSFSEDIEAFKVWQNS